MTPLHATLQGASGIAAGLGRDKIALDLSSMIPADAVTVAIKGDNGMGKSTLLNLAFVPWREPPQVAGGIYDQFGPTGLRELIWTHAGQEYWSRIEYKNTGKTRTQKAVLRVKQGDKWTPATLPDNTASDGKASTYDACLAHILGPQDLYYLAAFRAQHAASLAEHADPKGLMRALLALDEPAALADKARDVARDLKRAYEGIRDQAQALDAHPARIADLRAAIADIVAGSTARTANKLAAMEGVSRARLELDRALSGDIDRQRLIEQRAAVVARLERTAAEWDRRVSEAEAALLAAIARQATEKSAALHAERLIKSDIQQAKARVNAAASRLAGRDAIQAAEAEAFALAEQADTQEQTAEALATQIQALRELVNQTRSLKTNLDHIAADGKACAANLKDTETRAAFVALVPCKGMGDYAECPALAEAKAAAGQIPALKARVAAERQAWVTVQARILELSPQVAGLDALSVQHEHAKAETARVRARLEAVRKQAAQAPALALAEHNQAEALAAVADLAARLEEAQATHAASLAALDAEIAAAQATLQHAQADGAQALSDIQAELYRIPQPEADQIVTLARAALADADAQQQAAQDAIDHARAAQASHAAEMAKLNRDLEQGAAITAQARALEAEIADWTLLAMGMQGVIDLSIEDAGPGISAIANELLANAYGPRFSTRIVTQREQQNGITRECFDISVIDAESGLESSILQKSGGERVWLDKALTDAVALYHQQTAGQHYECLFADEAEDGLTQSRKQRFYRMDRAALEMGGYRRKYFISHNPDAWDMADAVIDLAEFDARG